MSDDAAAEWLAVAANELAGYETGRIRMGLAEARRTCTHHGQIIPCVFENMKYPWDMGKPLRRQLQNANRQLPPPEIQGLIEGAAKALTDR